MPLLFVERVFDVDRTGHTRLGRADVVEDEGDGMRVDAEHRQAKGTLYRRLKLQTRVALVRFHRVAERDSLALVSA